MYRLGRLLTQVLIVLYAIILNSGEIITSSEGGGKRFLEWEDVFNGTLSPKYKGIEWAQSGHYAIQSSMDGVWKVDPITDERIQQYFELKDLYEYDDFKISPDGMYAILIKVDRAKYRHSFYGNYSVINLDKDYNKRKNVTIDPTGNNNVQYCGFAPSGHVLIVVADNNLFTFEDPQTNVSKQHTEDGEENKIFNGIPDWVYEEEVVSKSYNNYPSPDGRYILFGKTNATGVRHVRFPIYGQDSYATILDYEYPKAGYRNPTIETWLVDLKAPEAQAYQLETPKEVKDWGEHYLYTVSWADSDTVVCEWWNRNQTELKFYKCEVEKGKTKCDHVFDYNTHGKGWMDYWNTPFWYFDGLDQFATLYPSNQGVEGDFKHIALFTANDDNGWDKKFLTSGNFDVVRIYGQDIEKKLLFYQASKGGQMYRHVFKLDITSGKSECLSCDGYCGYANADFSKDGTYYKLTCNGPVAPYQRLNSVDGTKKRDLENNNDLHKLLRTFTLPKFQYLTEDISGFDINIQRIAPPGFSEDESRRYPVLVYVYGGPDSGNVKDTFHFGDQRKDFHNYLANGSPGKPQFLVYMVDVRGTHGRGDSFRFPLYRKLGITEVEDTLEFLTRLRCKPYVDDARMAIWGWSYGGFLTSKVVSSGQKLVQAAIAVAPVTSYYFYDTIYTERYMGLPKYNKNYDVGGVLHEAANFKGTKYFLIHGSADDNVHYTNAARLAFQLVENGIDFRMHVYTDKAHSLAGSRTRRHLYTMIRDWLYQSLNLTDDYNYFNMEL